MSLFEEFKNVIKEELISEIKEGLKERKNGVIKDPGIQMLLCLETLDFEFWLVRYWNFDSKYLGLLETLPHRSSSPYGYLIYQICSPIVAGILA